MGRVIVDDGVNRKSVRSLWYCSACSAYRARRISHSVNPFIVGTKASYTLLGPIQCRKQCDYERVGCAEAMESGCSLRCLFFPFVSKCVKGGKGIYVEEYRYVSRLMDRRILLVCIYPCFYRWLFSWGCDREREWIGERLSTVVRWNRSILCCFTLGVSFSFSAAV